jgi:hypothetical protein
MKKLKLVRWWELTCNNESVKKDKTIIIELNFYFLHKAQMITQNMKKMGTITKGMTLFGQAYIMCIRNQNIQ